MLQPPTITEDFGTINGVHFTRYRGRFVRQTLDRPHDVPYEIVAPDQRREAPECPGRHTVVCEVPHHSSGMPFRSLSLALGFAHASVGYSLLANRSLDASMVLGQVMPPLPLPPPLPDFEYWEQYTDHGILVDFAKELRKRPLGLQFDAVYSIGVSEAANSLNKILARGERLFELSFPLTATEHLKAEERERVQGRVMELSSEFDFQPFDADSDKVPGPFRSYQAAGCPHIPHMPGGRPPTPLSWSIYLPALVLAGHAWVTQGKEPPESQYIALAPHKALDSDKPPEDPILRDEKKNAVGGIRHPALETMEARFIAWGIPEGFFGSYADMETFPVFYGGNWRAYAHDFENAARALKDDLGLLLEGDVIDLVGTLVEGKTFTNVFAGTGPREGSRLAEVATLPGG